MGESHEDSAPEYGLVMPFVVVASKGGPFDDQPYVAGYECGQIDARLEHERPPLLRLTVHSPNVFQLDLVAMRQGYTMTTVGPMEDGQELTEVEFVRLDVAEGVTS